MRYIVEVADFSVPGGWAYYAEADNADEARALCEHAKIEHPKRRVRIRHERYRADIDG